MLYSINSGTPTPLPHRYTRLDGRTATAEAVLPAMIEDGYSVVPADPTPATLWNESATWEGTQWVVAPDPETAAKNLNGIVAHRIGAVEALLEDTLSAPLSYTFPAGSVATLESGTTEPAGTRQLQMRPSDRQVWQMVHQTSLAAVIMGQGDTPYPTGIRTLDNAVVSVSYTEALTMCNAIFEHGSALTAQSWTLKNNIRKCATPSEVEEVVIEFI